MTDASKRDGTPSRLDLLSTSQKFACDYGAPYVALRHGDKHTLIQSCCNHWDCRRCGELRAKVEYGRIVSGTKELSETHDLYFYTFTCRGKSLSLDVAQRDYLLWTNRLLSTMRAKSKTEGGYWCYVQVTERQKRGHPHSHLLMCWLPSDARWKLDSKGKPYYYSKWFSAAHTKSGLGTQSRVTPVGSVEAVARYVAKYLFKDANFTIMPPKWKRVRYSQNFPKRDTDAHEKADEFTVIKTAQDWRKIERGSVFYECPDMMVWQVARHHTRMVKQGW